MSISELVNEISSGEIVLPAIQRNFVWDEARVVTLFDSLFRGYPVGIALIWETYDPIQFRRFPLDHKLNDLYAFSENKKGQRLKLVLDGQQRLSSIYIALKGTFSGKKLFFDVLSGRGSDNYSEMKYGFRFLADAEAAHENSKQAEATNQDVEDRNYWVRLSDMLGQDPSDIIHLRKSISSFMSLSEKEKDRLEINFHNASYVVSGSSELLKTQVIDSKLPANDKKRKSAFDILEIFVRVNTQGIRLQRSDLIVSLLRLYWEEASTLLPNLIVELNEGNNFGIDNDFVIRCMFVTAGLGTRLDFELLRNRKNVERIKETYKHCFDAIRSALDFVKSECGIESSRLLGGHSTLVPFVYYLFHTNGHVMPKGSKQQARMCLFLFAFSKVFTQHVDSRTGSFIRSYLPSSKEIGSGAVMPIKGAITYTYWKTSFEQPSPQFFSNNRELALSLIQSLGGGKVLFSSNKPELDHIFPRSTLAEKQVEPQVIDSIGNMWILPQKLNRNKSNKPPRTFLADVDDNILKSAFIDREMLDGRVSTRFIKEREATLTQQLIKLTGLSPERFTHLSEDEVEEEEEA